MSCLLCQKRSPSVADPKNLSARSSVRDSRPIETITLSDGSEYTGTLKDNKPDGFGTLKYKNGEIYVGDFVNGKKEGKGKWTEAGGDMYEGEWKNDRKHGHGIYTTSEKFVYEGGFENNKRKGKGTVTLPDKTRYLCNFDNDKEVGESEFFFYNGDHALGYIKDGNLHGNGRYEFKNGDIYVGPFKDGLFHGKGYYKWNVNSSYKIFEGNYVNGVKSGEGILKNTDGRVLVGTFVKNNLHGEVLEISNQGNQTKVLFNNGKFVKVLDKINYKLDVREYLDEKYIETSIFTDPNAYKKFYEFQKKKKAQVKLNLKEALQWRTSTTST